MEKSMQKMYTKSLVNHLLANFGKKPKTAIAWKKFF